jgi:hypothetical protein
MRIPSRVSGTLATVARVGQAQAFFGNLYEAVVRVPHLLAHDRTLPGRPPLHPGSPTLYYVPAGPVALAASLATLATTRGDRRWQTTSTAATTAAAALTVYVVTRVNKPLLLDEAAPSPACRDALLTRWYRLNAVRMALLGLAWLASEKARATRR